MLSGVAVIGLSDGITVHHLDLLLLHLIASLATQCTSPTFAQCVEKAQCVCDKCEGVRSVRVCVRALWNAVWCYHSYHCLLLVYTSQWM